MPEENAKSGSFDTMHRRGRTKPISTGKRVSPQERDLIWIDKMREHGPLSTSYLLGFSKHLGMNEKRARERLTDLFNETNTPHRGPYLMRPPQQFRTIDSRYNELVYDLTPASRLTFDGSALAGSSSANASGPWLHNYMVSCITASIELGTLSRQDVTYIPGSKILSRADAELRFTTQIQDPTTKQIIRKDLIPDALFGLEYKRSGKSTFRFFVVEADRGTEPTTTTNFNRKSHLRSLLQYQDYIENGGYKEHLNLTAPLMVLNVCSNPKKLEKIKSLTSRLSGDQGNSYMCFAQIAGFAEVFKPRKPQQHLLQGQWQRAGRAPFAICAP